MYSFTPGVVAAIINAAVAILQFVIPNALIFTLVATLSEDHTAVTWSVVARSLQSSVWPLLLRSDSAASKHVQRSTEIIVLLRPIALGLVALAAIVTPLGLYEAIEPVTAPHSVKFVRQPDEGPFGILTPPRSELGFSRDCSDVGGVLPGQCPGTNTIITYANNSNSFNATIPNDDYDKRIPAQLAELYQSGLATQRTSVSSFFDIEWRWYNTHKRDNMRNISYTVDSYHSIAPVIGDGDVKLIEGLIVDTREGGVGFRSHAVPFTDDVPYGAEWEEDILFLVPETACVDTNLTLENKMPSEYDYGGPTMSIVDQGGFVELSRDIPWGDTLYQDTQQDPELRTRAYRAAWVTNVLNMFYLNVTRPGTNMTAPFDSHVGKRFAVNNSLTEYGPEGHSAALMALAIVEIRLNGLIDMPYDASEDEDLPYESYGYANPYDIGQTNYTVSDDVCKGFFVGIPANSTNIQVKCGLVLGPANKTNGPDTPLVEPGTIWTRPIHMCASATKATIKTVSFSFNQTRGSGLDALSVKSMQDKQYTSEDDMPTWGIETPNMTLSAIEPLWGLIDPASADLINITTLRSPHLYIPAGSSAYTDRMLALDGGDSNVPGTSAPAAIWNTAYAPRDLVSTSLQDLSGLSRMSLASMWKRMSTTSAGTAGIMNLIWTDFAANALVGTRGWVDDRGLPPNLQGASALQKRDDPATSRASTSGSASVPVRIYVRQTHYRWLYAIPAAVTLLLAAIICAAALVALACGKGSVARIGYYLNHLSAGRLLVAVQTRVREFGSKREVWLEGGGRTSLALATDGDGDGDGLLEGDEDDGRVERHVVQPKRDRGRSRRPWRR